jgi:hypothetical protein
MRHVFDRINAFLFHDQVRLIEILSILCLAGYWQQFSANPEILDRASYDGFQFMTAASWATVTGVGAVLHALVLLIRWRWQDEARIVMMALACGFWVMVTLSFASIGLSSTAIKTYSAIAILCFISGVFLAWTTSSRH